MQSGIYYFDEYYHRRLIMINIKKKMTGAVMAFALVLAFLLVCALSACSNGADTDTSANPYAEDFTQMRERATNDMQRDILADDKITEAEIKEVTEIFKSCLKEHGVFFAEYKHFSVDTDADKVDLAEGCRESSVGELQSLYQMTVTNPSHLDFHELKYQCLIRREIIPKDLTFEEYIYYSDKHSKEYSIATGDEGTFIINEDGSRTPLEVDEYGNPSLPMEPLEYVEFPNGVSLEDKRVLRCDTDPSPESD
jgi:hypothetical protein